MPSWDREAWEDDYRDIEYRESLWEIDDRNRQLEERLLDRATRDLGESGKPNLERRKAA